ncbi:MAG: hypothetical protein AB8G86_19665 [Saprospiraceae bacterium]
MRYFNIFYLFVVLTGLFLWKMNSSMYQTVITFYGFAENKETEINFNYSVAVDQIHISPGQMVKAGEPLLAMHRIQSKETLVDQPFRIQELRAKEQSWKTEKEGDIKLIRTKKRLKLEQIAADIKRLQEEKKMQAALFDNLKSVKNSQPNYAIVDAKIVALQKERGLTIETFDQEVNNTKQEINVGASPYRAEIKRLMAEQAFDVANKTIDIQLEAPTDGVIGNIYCKEAEHIPSYKTLISFYEPNPSLVKGFVQEDLILHVALQDSFLIRSTKDATTFCYGVVTGLGSRVVEIPERLRKIPDYKTYGREILVRIPKENNFLQKEKVILEFINQPEGISAETKRKPIVDLKVKE